MSSIQTDPACDQAACGCCGANAWRRQPYTDAISYLECRSCHYWVQQTSDGGNRTRRFEEEQRKFYEDDSLLLSPTFPTLSAEITARRVATVLRHLPRGTRLIEAGPGAGDVVRSLTESGYFIDAVEHSPVLAARLKDLYGTRVMTGDFAEQILPDGVYDAYCSFHVIEHVVDFRRHLDVARRCVRPGGLAFIATPNSRGWEQRLPFRLSLNNDSSHFQLFSEHALSKVLRSQGWEIIAADTPSYAIAWLRIITKVLRRIRGLDEDTTGGHFARSSSRKLGVAVSVFARVTRPLRWVQERACAGNELFVVARRVE